MKVARIVISDRGDWYLPQMLASMDKHVDYPWDQDILIDDRAHALGMAGAVQAAWSEVRSNIDYVFHAEEDFLFLRPVSVAQMCRTIEYNTHLSQLVLKRGPWSPEERSAGGIMEMYPDDYFDMAGWVEHRRIFSLNPCVYPAWVARSIRPLVTDAGVEQQITDRMLADGYVFGFWGARGDAPMVEHVGEHRGQGWRL